MLSLVAILPQLFLVRRTGEVENMTSNYIAAMGAFVGALCFVVRVTHKETARIVPLPVYGQLALSLPHRG